MRYVLSTHTTAAIIDRPRLIVQSNYAARARAEEQSCRRREVVWSVLSLITLVLCWDLAARLDQRVLGDESLMMAHAETAAPMRKPGSPRRLRKLSEEAEDEMPRSFEATK